MGLATGAISVVGIGNRNNPSRERNVLSTELIGVPGAIPAFVVVAYDGAQIPQKWQPVAILLREHIENGGTANWMRLILMFVARGTQCRFDLQQAIGKLKQAEIVSRRDYGEFLLSIRIGEDDPARRLPQGAGQTQSSRFIL